jgi:hypothetical protein
MDQSISTAVTLVLAVSVAVERVTEILKQMFPILATALANDTSENRRRAVLQLLAAAVGTVIAWFGDLQLGTHGGPSAWVLIGLMSSGGSAFWNHALDALRAMKVTQEATAAQATKAAA